MADLPVPPDPASPVTQSQGHSSRSNGRQFSLKDLFLLTTVSAVLVVVYLSVSRMAALFGAGNVLAIAVVRWSGCRNILLGGLIGFLISTAVADVVILVGKTITYATLSLLVICPAAGYLVGACLAELQNLTQE
ncbi:MAG: hypothetical protein D6753_18695 [Planctomycetota bacterium]|nr:MAG: hypothetical protein D6753_18695 [Planctomycetota bacterium]